MYEIQVKYTDGWATVSTPMPCHAEWAWEVAKHRWSKFKLRCLLDGRVIRRTA